MAWLAYRVEESEHGFHAAWQEQQDSDLAQGEVIVEVAYSSVNFKDALSAHGNKGVTREFPHTPGIDAAGVVISDSTGKFSAGDEVVLFGYDLGMNTNGGYGQRIAVPAQWVLKKPAAISAADAMAWGTAGFTAALSVEKLLQMNASPEKGPVLVTGATGGVGSVAVAILTKLGFEVIAATGKPEAAQWLKAIGASSLIARDDLLAFASKAVAKPIYQAAVDTCGGDMIAALLPQILPNGSVTTCGMVAGPKFSASVFPFILRGVNLLGIDSVEIAPEHKQSVLDKAASEWQLPALSELTTEVGRSELHEVLGQVYVGKGKGRYLVNLNKD